MLEESSRQGHVGHGSTDSAMQHLVGAFTYHCSGTSPGARTLKARGVFPGVGLEDDCYLCCSRIGTRCYLIGWLLLSSERRHPPDYALHSVAARPIWEGQPIIRPEFRPRDLLTSRHMCKRISTQRIVASDFASAVIDRPYRSVSIRSAAARAATLILDGYASRGRSHHPELLGLTS